MIPVKARKSWPRRVVPVLSGALLLAILFVLPDLWGASAAVAALPPRPTPAVTPLPTPTPLPAPVRRQPAEPAPLGHILLTVTPAAEGLWTVVEWQGADGVWHPVAGWQGMLVAGRQRWAVFERNFGQGPFRWVVYGAVDGEVRGVSATFMLPASDGERVLRTLALNP